MSSDFPATQTSVPLQVNRPIPSRSRYFEVLGQPGREVVLFVRPYASNGHSLCAHDLGSLDHPHLLDDGAICDLGNMATMALADTKLRPGPAVQSLREYESRTF
jgi:hypothetical protein